MTQDFERHRLDKDDDGYEYDKQADFVQDEDCDWDDD